MYVYIYNYIYEYEEGRRKKNEGEQSWSMVVTDVWMCVLCVLASGWWCEMEGGRGQGRRQTAMWPVKMTAVAGCPLR